MNKCKWNIKRTLWFHKNIKPMNHGNWRRRRGEC
jgi:hypothetical protein